MSDTTSLFPTLVLYRSISECLRQSSDVVGVVPLGTDPVSTTSQVETSPYYRVKDYQHVSLHRLPVDVGRDGPPGTPSPTLHQEGVSQISPSPSRPHTYGHKIGPSRENFYSPLLFVGLKHSLQLSPLVSQTK